MEPLRKAWKESGGLATARLVHALAGGAAGVAVSQVPQPVGPPKQVYLAGEWVIKFITAEEAYMQARALYVARSALFSCAACRHGC